MMFCTPGKKNHNIKQSDLFPQVFYFHKMLGKFKEGVCENLHKGSTKGTARQWREDNKQIVQSVADFEMVFSSF